MIQIIIINGPNLNLLGKRQPEIYGHKSFEDYFVELEREFPEFNLHYYQSNHEALRIHLLLLQMPCGRLPRQ